MEIPAKRKQNARAIPRRGELHPALAERMLILRGNHDLNIVDRLNPGGSICRSAKRLRQMRTLSAVAAIQGHRVRVIDESEPTLDRTLAEARAPHRRRIAAFADTGSLRLPIGLGQLWHDQFPLILRPARLQR